MEDHLSSPGAAATADDLVVARADDHLMVADALLRFGIGIDMGDLDLLASAFSEDASVDFGPCGRKLGLEFPVLTGGGTIVGFLGATCAMQTTSHVITNVRVRLEGETARLRALVDATHLPKGDHSRNCRMMNWYVTDLVKQAAIWRIGRLVIDNVWFSGDPRVLSNQ